MRRFYITTAIGITALLGLSFWKNNHSYNTHSLLWKSVKSVIDCLTVLAAAVYVPALLIGWSVIWLTRGVQRRGVQITLAVVLGILFSSISGVLLDLLCVLGIFSVDLLTGEQGLYGWWVNGPPPTFLPSLNEQEEG